VAWYVSYIVELVVVVVMVMVMVMVYSLMNYDKAKKANICSYRFLRW